MAKIKCLHTIFQLPLLKFFHLILHHSHTAVINSVHQRQRG